MAIQSGTFKRLPGKEVIRAQIEEERRHLNDLSSYMWYIMPIADRFGEQVYEVAAKSLAESGLKVTASEMKTLAEELSTPEGMERYAENRRRHVLLHICG
jgi:uncharacterized membrane protein YpjA